MKKKSLSEQLQMWANKAKENKCSPCGIAISELKLEDMSNEAYKDEIKLFEQFSKMIQREIKEETTDKKVRKIAEDYEEPSMLKRIFANF